MKTGNETTSATRRWFNRRTRLLPVAPPPLVAPKSQEGGSHTKAERLPPAKQKLPNEPIWIFPLSAANKPESAFPPPSSRPKQTHFVTLPSPLAPRAPYSELPTAPPCDSHPTLSDLLAPKTERGYNPFPLRSKNPKPNPLMSCLTRRPLNYLTHLFENSASIWSARTHRALVPADMSAGREAGKYRRTPQRNHRISTRLSAGFCRP
jgi:hypothetical protein